MSSAATAPRRARAAGSIRSFGPLPWLGGLLLAYLFVPVLAFFIRLPGVPHDQLGSQGLGSALGLSLATASVATAIIAVLGIPLAYLLAHSTGRLARVVGVLIQVPLALPPLVSGLLLIFLVGPYTPLGVLTGGRLTDSATGIVLAQVFVAAPFLIVSARSAFAAVDPALDDVAATLGHGRMSRFARVALPGAAGGIRAGMLLSWLRGFGEFGATVILAYNPNSLPVFIFAQFSGSGLNATMLPILATIVAAFLVLVLADRRPRRGRFRRVRIELPPPRTPGTAVADRLDFTVDTTVGEFSLQVTHRGAGQHLAIMGASGAGKSMTMRALAGLAVPKSGFVRLGDADLTAMPPQHRSVGYLPQDSTLLPHLRVAEQVTFGAGTDARCSAYWLHRL
ncbi:MAG: ATP-binding cassette domain-containing protein, partial [Sciscionella sp.]